MTLPNRSNRSSEPGTLSFKNLLLLVETGVALTALPASSAWGQSTDMEVVNPHEPDNNVASDISASLTSETASPMAEAPKPQPEFDALVAFTANPVRPELPEISNPIVEDEELAINEPYNPAGAANIAHLEQALPEQTIDHSLLDVPGEVQTPIAEPTRLDDINIEIPPSEESEPDESEAHEPEANEPEANAPEASKSGANEREAVASNEVQFDRQDSAPLYASGLSPHSMVVAPQPEVNETVRFSTHDTALVELASPLSEPSPLPPSAITDLPESYSTEADALLQNEPSIALVPLSEHESLPMRDRSQSQAIPITAQEISAADTRLDPASTESLITLESSGNNIGQPDLAESETTEIDDLETANLDRVNESGESHERDDSTDISSRSEGAIAYLVPPEVIPNDNINPFLTTRTLNGTIINHQSGWSSTSGVNVGDAENLNLDAIGTLTLNSQVEQSITAGNVLGINQSTQVIQSQTVVTDREVTLSQRESVGMLGEHIRMSLTASCILPGTDVTQQCSYTPGLVVEESDLDPDLLIPRQIRQTGDFGEVLTPESVAAIQQPGFQRGADGQEIALDIYLPNLGLIPAEGNATHITRSENVSTTPVLGYADIRQSISANDQEASLARTVRSPIAILGGDQTWANVGLALASLFLPNTQASVADSDQPFNSNLNQSLFLAANNSRLPANSFTLYESGSGRADTPTAEMDNLEELPPATYQTLWLGLSPETQRTITNEESLELTGDREILFDAGGEGGVNSDVEFVSLINNLPYSADNLNDVYTQVYLTVFRQNADLVSTTRQVDQTKYYPHLSYSGNVTGAHNVFRYYTGIIAADELRPYGGVDYALHTPDGWSYDVAAIAVLNPSYENYSQLAGGVEKRFNFSDSSHLRLGSRLNWAIDQESQISGLNSRPEGSDAIIQAQLALGPVSTGITQSFGNILPHSRPSRTVSNLSFDITDQVSLGGYYTLADQSDTVPQAGLALNWRLGDDPGSPVVGISWNNTRYEYANGAFSTSDNNFGLSVKLGL